MAWTLVIAKRGTVPARPIVTHGRDSPDLHFCHGQSSAMGRYVADSQRRVIPSVLIDVRCVLLRSLETTTRSPAQHHTCGSQEELKGMLPSQAPCVLKRSGAYITKE